MRLLTVSEVAEMLRVKPSTVYNLKDRKLIAHFRIGAEGDEDSGKILFDEQDVIAYLHSRRVKAKEDD